MAELPPRLTDKADLAEYSFQLTENTGTKEAVWIRPLSILNGDDIAKIPPTHEQVLDILEAKSLNILSMVAQRRRDLRDAHKVKIQPANTIPEPATPA